MARDRIHHFTGDGTRPDLDALQVLLVDDYLQSDALWERLERTSDGHVLFVVLPGENRRIEGAHEDRYLEIYVDDDHVDVMTRFADDYTNAVADGFYKLVQRIYDGEPG